MKQSPNYGHTPDKTKELILFIADFLKNQPTYGATLLNKALYFIDNLAYIKLGKPVSTLEYVKQRYGPTPKPSQFLAIKSEMINDGELEEKKSDWFGKVQIKCFGTREADITVFEKEEIVLINKVLDTLSGYNASAISNFSHGLMAWSLASMMEDLPLNTSLLSSKPPTEKSIQWAREKIAQL
jgi:hypothetical protein